MTTEEVEKHVLSQAGDSMTDVNDHRISLGEALVSPREIPVIERTVRNGKVSDRQEEVWLVGQERAHDGYLIVMRDDGLQFGLASPGFPSDTYPILCGWYGGLISAFRGM